MKKFFQYLRRPKRVFLVFLCVHFALWALLPELKTTMHPDSLEAIDWGMIGGWVNDKHPPLSGFLANLFWQIGGHSDLSIYILAQACMAAAFAYVYLLARLMFSDWRKAALCAMLLEGVLYYSMTASDQFNCNIVSIPLWAASAFYVWRATHGGCGWNWIFAGAAIGLNMLDKYTAAFQLFGLGGYLIAGGHLRAALRSPWAWAGGAVAALIFAPHFLALQKTGFVSLEYLSSNAISGSLPARLIDLASFALSLLAAAALAISIYFAAFRGAERGQKPDGDIGKFLIWAGLAPIALFIAQAVAMGLKLSTMWGIPFLILTGIALFRIFPRKMSDKAFRRAVAGVYISMAVFAAANLGKYIFNNKHRIHFDHSAFAAELSARWSEATNEAPIKFVCGDTWFASIISLYEASHPQTILNIDKHYRRVLNDESLAEHGLLIVGTTRVQTEKYLEELREAAPIAEYNYQNCNMLGNCRSYRMFYAIIPPSSDKTAE
jgi:hypothetical protein